jgi:hypothetical protein
MLVARAHSLHNSAAHHASEHVNQQGKTKRKMLLRQKDRPPGEQQMAACEWEER